MAFPGGLADALVVGAGNVAGRGPGAWYLRGGWLMHSWPAPGTEWLRRAAALYPQGAGVSRTAGRRRNGSEAKVGAVEEEPGLNGPHPPATSPPTSRIRSCHRGSVAFSTVRASGRGDSMDVSGPGGIVPRRPACGRRRRCCTIPRRRRIHAGRGQPGTRTSGRTASPAHPRGQGRPWSCSISPERSRS